MKRSVALLAACLTMLGVARAAETGVTDKEILIGSFAPLTGPSYLYGKLPMNGIEAYFAKVNEEGGVFGRKLRLVRQDDFCKPEGAIAAVKKLIFSDGVFMIHGAGCSAATLAAKPEIVKAQVPFVVFGATADEITSPPSPGIFTTQLTSAIESRVQLRRAFALDQRKIAIVWQRDSWGQSRFDPLIEAMKEAGVKPVAIEELSVDANDASAQVLRLREAKPDAVMLLLYPKPAAVLLRDAFKFGVKAKWIGQSGINDLIAFRNQVGNDDAVKDFVTISPLKYQPADPEMADWSARIKKMFPADDLSIFNLQGIGSAEVVVEALRRAGPDLTREKFVQAFGSLKDFKTQVFSGPITCNSPKSHQCNESPAWMALINGKPTILDK